MLCGIVAATMQIAFSFPPLCANCKKPGTRWSSKLLQKVSRKRIGTSQAKKFQEGEVMVRKGLQATKRETLKQNEPTKSM